MSRRALLLAVVLVLALAGALGWRALRPEEASGTSPSARPTVTRTPSPIGAIVPGATLAARPTPKAKPRSATGLSSGTLSCGRPSAPFDPSRITAAGTTSGVVMPPRDGNGVPGVPPVSTSGKYVFAYDRAQGIRPGDPAGNVLLNAHTWPDGSALGNRLLSGLHTGDLIAVRGSAGQSLCYRVTQRIEVPASRQMPSYFATSGPHQLAIVVCSGRRFGPGNWENRTIWFAGVQR